MTKIIIYKDYDLIEELQNIIDDYYTERTIEYKDCYLAIEKDIAKIIKIIKASAEVMIKNENSKNIIRKI